MKTSKFNPKGIFSLLLLGLVSLLANAKQEINVLYPILDIEWDRDGAYYATLDNRGNLIVVNADISSPILQFTKEITTPLDTAEVSWSPNSQFLAVGIEHEIYIWDTNSWLLIEQFISGDIGEYVPFEGGPIRNGISSINWSLDSKYIIVGSANYRTVVWDNFNKAIIYSSYDHSGGGPGRVWLENGWTSDGVTKLNVFTNERNRLENPERQQYGIRGSAIGGTTESDHNNGKIAWGTDSGVLAIIDLNTLHRIQGFDITYQSTGNNRENPVVDIAWSEENSFIATASKKGSLNLVNLVSNETMEILRIAGLYSVDWKPNSNEIIYSGINETGELILEIVDVTGIAGVPPLPSILFSESDDSTIVAESGETDIYTLALGTQPTTDVVVSMASDAAQLTVSPSTLTFTSENWDTPQTVTIVAVDDALVEGEHTSFITHSAVSTDPAYDGIAVASVTVTIVDNDFEPTAIPTVIDTLVPTIVPTVPTDTPIPTNTPVTPTATDTLIPTNTPITPTATNTPIPPTATNTPVPPTATYTPTATADANPCDASGVVPGMGWILFSSGTVAGERSIYAARPNDSQPIRLTCGSPSFIDLQPVWSADRSLIVFTRQTSPEVPSSLWIMRADNPAGAVPLTTGVNTPTVGLRPTMSPDGQWIAYTSEGDLYAIKINPATLQVVPGTLVNLTPNGDYLEIRPDWSPVTDPTHPNYNRITYISNRAGGNNTDGNSEVYTMLVTFTNGLPSLSGRVQVTNTTTVNGLVIQHQYPRWSQDGNYIAYSSNIRDGTDFDINRVTYNPTTGTWGNRNNLTSMRFSHDDEFVAWDPELVYGAGETPDNTYRFVFASQPEDDSDSYRIVLMERRGGGTPTTMLPPWATGTGGQRFPDW